MVRRKKSNSEESCTNITEYSVKMDIDIQALREKNKVLVQSVAKLQQEKAVIQKQHTALQEEYFKLNSKFVNLKSIFTSIDSTTKLAFSNMADGVNQLAKVMHLCSVGTAVSGLNKEPQTLTVKPHMVNGTIIKNPTITLSRFNDSDSPERTQNTLQQQQDQGPSTSRALDESFSAFFNNSNKQNEENEQENLSENVSQRSRRNTVTSENSSEENIQDPQSEEYSDQDEDANDHTYCQRLMTIDEEPEDYDNLNSSAVTDRVREIRIYLSPLPSQQTKDDTCSELSLIGRSSSLSAEGSNSIMERTLLNESHESARETSAFLNSIDISLPPASDSRFEGFNKTIDETKNSPQGMNQPSCSFMDNISSIMRFHSPHDSTDISTEELKIRAMRSLGLMEKRSEQLTTSTPVLQTSRSSRRLINKKTDVSSNTSKVSPLTSPITKRKESSGIMSPKVILKRLNLDKTASSVQNLTDILDNNKFMTSTETEIRIKKRNELIDKTPATATASPENDIQTKERLLKKKKVQIEGKENRKRLLVSVQTIKSSPRPKRAARPTVLRESSLKKKMRRSR